MSKFFTGRTLLQTSNSLILVYPNYWQHLGPILKYFFLVSWWHLLEESQPKKIWRYVNSLTPVHSFLGRQKKIGVLRISKHFVNITTENIHFKIEFLIKPPSLNYVIKVSWFFSLLALPKSLIATLEWNSIPPHTCCVVIFSINLELILCKGKIALNGFNGLLPPHINAIRLPRSCILLLQIIEIQRKKNILLPPDKNAQHCYATY